MIEAEVITLTLRGDADKSNDVFAAVLTENQIAPGRDGEVVGIVDQIGVVWLNEQFKMAWIG